MKRYLGIIGLCLVMFFLGFIFADIVSPHTKNGQTGESSADTADELYMTDQLPDTTEDTNEVTEQETVDQPRKKPELLHDADGFNNRYFYVYYPRPLAYDGEHGSRILWEFISGEGKKHNEWIETQTFTSLFRYGDKCIRAGYLNETGQWGVTFFYYHGLYTEYIGMGQSLGTTITYPQDETWLVAPNAFGVPNDHSVEITFFDETKQTVTLTFTSPEGETTEVYINYEKQCRCDENGTPLLNEDGNTFLYQFEGDFIGTQYHELN